MRIELTYSFAFLLKPKNQNYCIKKIAAISSA
jgi:hypothetical protein